MIHLEQACSTNFWETRTLSRPTQPGLCSYSQLHLRKRGLIFSSSLYKIHGTSLCFRNQVNNFNSYLTFTRAGKRWMCLPEALTENIYDAREKEAEIGKEGNYDTCEKEAEIGKEGNYDACEKEAEIGKEGNHDACEKEAEIGKEGNYDACEKEVEIGNKGKSDGSLNSKQTVAIEAVGTKSEKVRQISKKTEENGLQPLKWPLWFLGPTLLLATGAIPTLWLPFSSIFSGFNMTSLLSLTGLDGIFNMGATLFLLIADYCARPKKGHVSYFKIPFSYKFWNFLFNLIGIVVPSFAMVASYRNILQPQVHLLSLAAMLGPYLMLLLVQMLAELLTWHWESPVWLIVPVVYEAYRLLQLSRGLELGIDLDAPTWLMEGMKGLVAWWVLVLGFQLMKIAWFVGQQPNRQEA